ncbi:MAG: tRNA (adenosine(37)-N6)-dimethylallyltransferase MiaA [Candidatus Omnitrophica bacterium]|nr:tRNA (adenosine(37)-N6)-dimethylallyltransferase MiaA [Candidatus Omnitrophota bacterium]
MKDLSKAEIIFVVGPTAVGKSAYAFDLAQACQGEIVSCDAMQVYREAMIVSDKPSLAMRQAVAHHVVDVVSVEEEFSVARYRDLALKAIADIMARGKRPIICGGSGMYMMALLDGIFEGAPPAPEIREALKAEWKMHGIEPLYARLSRVDPDAARKINANDPQRIIRALEIFEATGKLISQLQKERDGLWGKYLIQVIGLTRPRAVLYARAEGRIEAMFEQGLVAEIQGLLQQRLSSTASRMIGVREIGGHLAGDYGLDRAKYLMKLNTRHYIKRQLTWFRRDDRLEWKELV